jgi:hypothetical protein
MIYYYFLNQAIIWEIYIIFFDKTSFDETSFDELTFDKLTFDKKLFDQKSFDQKLFDEKFFGIRRKVHSTKSHSTIGSQLFYLLYFSFCKISFKKHFYVEFKFNKYSLNDCCERLFVIRIFSLSLIVLFLF